MYTIMIYMGYSIHKLENGSLLPMVESSGKKMGVLKGFTVEECKEKFNKMVPEDFVEVTNGPSN